MADKKISDFASIETAVDDDLVLISSAGETYNMKLEKIREYIAAVPTSRKVAGKSLAADILLAAEDVGAIPVPDDPAAKGYVVAVDAIGTNKRPTAWRYVSARPDQQVFFCDEIDIPPINGASVSLDGLSWYPTDPLRAGDIVVGRNGYYAEVDDGNSSDEDTATSVGHPIIDTSAEKSAYAGRVGSATVTNVAAALSALVVGAPLDMSADYAASGAATVQAWATMAKTGDATRYRVAAGRYSISDEDYEIGYLITIIDTPGVSYRTVWVASVTDFAFVDCYTALDPGEDVQHVVAFDTESNLLEINGQLVTLPAYTETYKGRLLTIGEDGTPQWATKPPYKAAEIACQYSDINGYEADTLAGALQLIAQDLSGLRPPHIVLNVAVASGVGELGSATENGTAISLTNASGAADYTALLAAINSAVPKGGSVEMYVDSDGYYSGMICRRPDSVDIIFLDVANPLDFNDALSFYRCHIWATGVEITNVEV